MDPLKRKSIPILHQINHKMPIASQIVQITRSSLILLENQSEKDIGLPIEKSNPDLSLSTISEPPCNKKKTYAL